jgi:cob(I)alamin adenosyltransferase
MIETARSNARQIAEDLFALQSQLATRQLEQTRLVERYVIESLETSRKNYEQAMNATNELSRRMMDLLFPAESAKA